MKIKSYKFGQIVIDNQKYTSDIMICGDDIRSGWWREQGHSLSLKDLEWILDKNPDILIIGTGKNGVMKVPNRVKKKLKEKNIKTYFKKTNQAINIYNNFKSQKSSQLIAAGFHLTC